MLTNSDPDMRESLQQAIREHPHDSATRHIYSDWLEENNHPDEAFHHRIIALGIDRGSEAARRYSVAEFGHGDIGRRDITQFRPTPSTYLSAYKWRLEGMNPLYSYDKNRKTNTFTRRLSTPLESSKAATRAGAGLMTQSNMPSVKYARDAEYNAEREARTAYSQREYPLLAEEAIGHKRGAILSHEMAAEHHLQAADDLEIRGTGRYRHSLARLHRRAALAHLYASFIHRAALGEV